MPAIHLEFLSVSLSAPGQSGWIGTWAPGIGDPTPVGWLTVAAYAFCALLCALNRLASKQKRVPLQLRESWFWLALAIVFGFLAINKQLDLQTAMTEMFRALARRQGWYDQRHEYQRAFVEMFAVVTVIASAVVLRLTWPLPRPLKIAGIGACLVFGYVLVRATSFHYVEPYLAMRILTLKVNWLCELSGIFIATAGAWQRHRTLRVTKAAWLRRMPGKG